MLDERPHGPASAGANFGPNHGAGRPWTLMKKKLIGE